MGKNSFKIRKIIFTPYGYLNVHLKILNRFSYLLFFFLGSCLWVHCVMIHSPRTPAMIQIFAIMTLSLIFVLLVEKILYRFEIIEVGELYDSRFFAVLVSNLSFAYVFGRHVFIALFYYDEWGYFESLNQNLPVLGKIILNPLNDHFVPVLKILFILLNGIFVTDYFGFGLASFLGFSLLLVFFCLLLKRVGCNPTVIILLSVSFATLTSFPDIHVWKGGGLWLILSCTLLLNYLVHSWKILDRPDSPRDLMVSAILCTLLVCVASQVMFPIIFLAPFLGIKLFLRQSSDRQKKRVVEIVKLAKILGISLAISLIYFSLRTQLAGIKPPHGGPFSFVPVITLLGGFLSTFLFYLKPDGDIVVSIVSLVVIFILPLSLVLVKITAGKAPSTLGARIRENQSSIVLMVLGGLIFGVAIAQIGFARGWTLYQLQSQRYALFPVMGAFIFLSGALHFVKWPLHGSRVRFGVVLFLVGIVIFQRHHLNRVDPLGPKFDEIEKRTLFLSSLESMICEVRDYNASQRGLENPKFFSIPDLGLEKCLTKGCDASIGPTPFYDGRYGFTVGYFARALNSSCYNINFLYWDHGGLGGLQADFALPNTFSFYKKYFGI